MENGRYKQCESEEDGDDRGCISVEVIRGDAVVDLCLREGKRV